ncbi:MAG: hypothetical protein JSV51_02750 [Candidatus Bathyarchaeota archaeon]|nr:MAG: hypothetical protein JSV51_02750 [Candidatus Bathyarchaeota archaeon]
MTNRATVLEMSEKLLMHIVKSRARSSVIWVMGKKGKPRKKKVYEDLEPLLCWKCEQLIKVGDRVYRKFTNGNQKSKYYHLSCWEETFVA